MLHHVGLEAGTDVSDELAAFIYFYTEDVTPKRWYLSTKLHVMTPQEIVVFAATALRISNPTVCKLLSIANML
jgi:hypothetical protein